MVVLEDPELGEAPGGEAGEPAGEPGWLTDKNGDRYVKAEGRRGIIRQQGDETVAEAIARDQQPRSQKRPRPKKPKMPPPPKAVDLRALEEMLADALKAPAVPAAAFGDEWAAQHFTTWGPALARNLVTASETNPWLRRKLENAANGGDMMMQFVSLIGVGGAVVMYALPPLVYWLNVPIPDKGREMLQIPERRTNGSPEDAYSATGA